VFIVSDFGGESVDEILAITESLPGHPAPSREAGEGTAGDATKGVGEGGRGYRMTAFGEYQDDETASCMKSRDYKDATDLIAQEPSVVSWNGDTTPKASEDVSQGVDVYSGQITGEIGCTVTTKTGVGDGSGPKVMSFAPSDITRGFGQKPEVELSGTLKKNHNDNSPHVVVGSLDCDERGPNLQSACSGHYIPVQGGEGVGVAFHASQDPIHSEEHTPALGSNATIGVTTYEWHNQDSRIREQQQASTLSCNAGGKEGNLVRENLTVRRLTPIECERLQGFPDNWTSEKMELTLEGNEWKATGKVLKQADGPRYKAMGNAVTVNVAEWIGKQIGKVLNETK
jgi:DNA (cytosine-5)-methyltransferase 1